MRSTVEQVRAGTSDPHGCTNADGSTVDNRHRRQSISTRMTVPDASLSVLGQFVLAVGLPLIKAVRELGSERFRDSSVPNLCAQEI